MIDMEDKQALEILKSTHESLALSLKNELDELKSRHKDLEVDQAQKTSHLIEALLTKEKLQNNLNDLAQEGRKAADLPDTEEYRKKMQDITDKARADVKDCQEVSNDITTRYSQIRKRGIKHEWVYDYRRSYDGLVSDALSIKALETVLVSIPGSLTAAAAAEAAELALELALLGDGGAATLRAVADIQLPISPTDSYNGEVVVQEAAADAPPNVALDQHLWVVPSSVIMKMVPIKPNPRLSKFLDLYR